MRALIFLVMASLAASAARADACRDGADRVMQRTDARLKSITPQFHNIVMTHRYATDMRALCGVAGAPAQLLLTLEGGLTLQFLTLAGDAAGALLQIPETGLPAAVGACLSEAALDPTQTADHQAGAALFECYVDPGAPLFSVTVMRAEE